TEFMISLIARSVAAAAHVARPSSIPTAIVRSIRGPGKLPFATKLFLPPGVARQYLLVVPESLTSDMQIDLAFAASAAPRSQESLSSPPAARNRMSRESPFRRQARPEYDLVVIGGGTAGLVAAGGAAMLGAKV